MNLGKRIYSSEALNAKSGDTVILAGWAEQIRVMGKLAFVILRDRDGLFQLTFLQKNFPSLADLSNLTRESVISAKGKIVTGKSRQFPKEMLVERFEVIHKAETPLPIEFLGRDIETQLPKRLDWRFLDLRARKQTAIFKVQAEICRAFREFMREKGFTEFFPPSIISAAAEGGTELFPANYFGKKVYLAQSPQLYKQMLTLGNLERVFTITPVWRAEPHQTHKHLNESRQMDIEAAFMNQSQVIKLLDDVVKHIVRDVLKKCKEQIALLNPDLTVPKSKMLSYDEALKALQKKNFKIKWGDDISTEAEKKLADIYGRNTLIHIHTWPRKLKPFYILPQGDKYSEGFDTDYGGIELSSGGQRLHLPKILTKQIKDAGLNPKNFKFYIDSFRYGAPPHSGFSIGLERLTMILTNQQNIRETVLFPRDMYRITP